MAGATNRVGLVIASHSSKIAAGVVELASQMAPDVRIEAAGGTDDGRIGTSFDLITTGIGLADDGAGVLILTDLGSAVLTAETALDFLDDDVRERVRISHAPVVEGAVAAAVAAQTGGSLDAVADAAEQAAGAGDASGPAEGATGDGASGNDPAEDGTAGGTYVREVELPNRDGLHARPAAEFVKLAATFDAEVRVNGTNARSLLGIMALGLTQGTTVSIAAPASAAGRAAVDALIELVESGFGET